MNVDAPLRNVDVDTTAPIAQWPAEAIEIIMDRGSLSDWRLLVAEIEREPWGPVARSVETIASWDEHYGVDRLMGRVIERARRHVDDEARATYAERIRRLRRDAGMTLKQLALAAGTSESRLSAYENGRVAPTTVVLGRIEAVVRERRAATAGRPAPASARRLAQLGGTEPELDIAPRRRNDSA